MVRRVRLVGMLSMLLIASLVAGQAMAQGEARRVTVELKDVGVDEALATVFRGSGASYVFKGELPRDRKVTLSLNNVEVGRAAQLVCEAAGLMCEEEDGVWVISPEWGVSLPGGVRLPVVGMRIGGGEEGPVELSVGGGGAGWPFGGPFGGSGYPSFRGEERLVDLEVEDVPLREVAQQLSGRAKVRISVHGQVPKEIKVTARAYQMPVGQVLRMLMDQTRLTYTVEKGKESDAVHIVPRPELRVSGMPGGLPWPAVATEVLRNIQLSAGGGALRKCPECERAMFMPDWAYCPWCGAKLPGGKAGAAEK